jgi:hypothetical protein
MRECDKFPGCIQDMFHLRYHKYLRRIEVSGLARFHRNTCTLWIDHGNQVHTGEIPAHTTIWDIHHQDDKSQTTALFSVSVEKHWGATCFISISFCRPALLYGYQKSRFLLFVVGLIVLFVREFGGSIDILYYYRFHETQFARFTIQALGQLHSGSH